MRNPRLSVAAAAISLLALAMGLAACGGDEAEPTARAATPEPTAVPAATATAVPEPTATATAVPEAAPTEAPAAPEEAPAMADDDALLAQYAAEHAGGPGAIFIGDPMQLIGLPPHEGLMFGASEEEYLQGATAALIGVEALGIPSHMFIYTSDYYRGLIAKANLTNPTELTSSGRRIEIQHTCIDRGLPTCALIQAYWAPRLAERTNGQVRLSVVSFRRARSRRPRDARPGEQRRARHGEHLHRLRGRRAARPGGPVPCGARPSTGRPPT